MQVLYRGIFTLGRHLRLDAYQWRFEACIKCGAFLRTKAPANYSACPPGEFDMHTSPSKAARKHDRRIQIGTCSGVQQLVGVAAGGGESA